MSHPLPHLPLPSNRYFPNDGDYSIISITEDLLSLSEAIAELLPKHPDFHIVEDGEHYLILSRHPF